VSVRNPTETTDTRGNPGQQPIMTVAVVGLFGRTLPPFESFGWEDTLWVLCAS
jgi:hypothetical protein